MARRPKRAWVARLTVAAAVLALPLFAAGVASAAIAAANPGTTAGRPDLRSVTLTSSTSAEVCFDKGLNTSTIAGNGNGFYVLGYRVDNRYKANSAAVDPTNGDCVILGFPSGAGGVGDINQYTVLSVYGGTVTDNLTGLPNNADSVALTGSTTNNGTTGHTTGPDLVGILTPSGQDQANNALEYQFDQSIASTPNATDFYFMDSGGNICWGNSGSSSVNTARTTVTVQFAKPCVGIGGTSANGETPGNGGTNGPNNIASISSAVRGGLAENAMNAANDHGLDGNGAASFNSSWNPNGSAVLPSANGATTRASLVSTGGALLSSTGDSVAFTFTTNVVIRDATKFAVWMSDGQYLRAAIGTASLISPNVVSVSFGSSLSTQDEYAVLGAMFPGAVEPAANPVAQYENTYEAVQVGDNSGALGRGFTTGADVFGVVFNASNGTVTADLDQRISSAENADICILNSAGDLVANPNPVSSDIPTQAAGPQAVTLQFVGGSNGPVAQGSMIEFGPDCVAGAGAGTYTKTDAFYSTLNYNGNNTQDNTNFLDGYTASQIVAPVGSGARLHVYHRSTKKHHSIKKHKRS